VLSGPGLSGSFAFAKLSPTVDTITFTFFGSTVLAALARLMSISATLRRSMAR
jgi:hypothetical protein